MCFVLDDQPIARLFTCGFYFSVRLSSSCTGDVLETGKVTSSVLHEGPLPHVLVNMEAEPEPQSAEPEPRSSDPRLDEPPEQSPSVAGSGSAAAAVAAAAPVPAIIGRPSGSPAASSARETGVVGSRGVVNAESSGGGGGLGLGLGGEDGGGAKRRGSGLGLPEIGPPKRVMLLPEVHPR